MIKTQMIIILEIGEVMAQPRKHSKKRDAILECIRTTTTHPSAEWVYAQLKPRIPDLSLATVYRNLALFKDAGDIVSLGVIQGLERFDGNPAPHIHFVCNHCGHIEDLPPVPVPPELEAQVKNKVKGQVTGFSLSFEGLCSRCCQEKSIG